MLLAVGWTSTSWFFVMLGGIAVAGAAVAAIPGIWGFIKATAKVPLVLEQVAQEFAPNGGGSMHDAIKRMDTTLAERTVLFNRMEAQQLDHTLAMEHQTIAFEQHLGADEVFFAFAKERFEEHDEFVQYTHARFHDILNEHQKVMLLLALPDDKRTEVASEMLQRRDVLTRSTDQPDQGATE